jgi:hypothetical protein
MTDVLTPAKPIKLKRREWVPPTTWKIPLTIGEEVDQAVEEWYGRLGIPVPLSERGIGNLLDAQDRQDATTQEETLEAAKQQQEDAPAGPKPEFGTPEFWAWARKRKNEKNAERAAQGLPPLPTAKEKAAAKATKDVAKAAKKQTP